MLHMSARRRWQLGVPAVLVAAAAAVFAAAGSLDPTFGTGGVVEIVPDQPGQAFSVAVQSDGKVVVGGRDVSSPFHWRIRRLYPDGSADLGFGAAGQVTLFGTISGTSNLNGIRLDGTGRILIVGSSRQYVTTGTGSIATTVLTTLPTVVRLNGDGSPDSTFGTAGIVTLILPGMWNSYAEAAALALRPDGKIVVAGKGELITSKKINKNGYQSARFAALLLGSGALDPAFGIGGVAIHDVTTKDDSVTMDCCALQSDGKILLGGTAGGSSTQAITRLLANGAVDTAFGSLWPPYTFRRLAVDGSDRIVASGAAYDANGGATMVNRYLSTGAVDTTFGAGGSVTIPGSIGGPLPIRVGPDGRITIGCAFSNGVNGAAAVRILTTGALDTSFGTGGISDAVFPMDLWNLALASDGGVVHCGARRDPNNALEWVVVRYLGN